MNKVLVLFLMLILSVGKSSYSLDSATKYGTAVAVAYLAPRMVDLSSPFFQEQRNKLIEESGLMLSETICTSIEGLKSSGGDILYEFTNSQVRANYKQGVQLMFASMANLNLEGSIAVWNSTLAKTLIGAGLFLAWKDYAYPYSKEFFRDAGRWVIERYSRWTGKEEEQSLSDTNLLLTGIGTVTVVASPLVIGAVYYKDFIKNNIFSIYGSLAMYQVRENFSKMVLGFDVLYSSDLSDESSSLSKMMIGTLLKEGVIRKR